MIRISKYTDEHPEHGQAIRDLRQRELEAQSTHDEDRRKYLLGTYGKSDVKEALFAESTDKCAYCESKFRPNYWGDVEHILPKAADPLGRTLNYENLTVACSICNNGKWDYEHPADTLLDPVRSEPEDHLTFLGPLLVRKNQSRMGKVTIEIVKLNRKDLFGARTEALQGCIDLYDQIIAEPNQRIRERLEARLRSMADSGEEFSLMKRCFVEEMLAGPAPV